MAQDVADPDWVHVAAKQVKFAGGGCFARRSDGGWPTGVTLACIGGLAASVQAFGGGPGIAAIGAVYLAAATIAAASPTPGGLGAIEAARIAGLTGIGLHPAAAVPAVLTYRLATYWLWQHPAGPPCTCCSGATSSDPPCTGPASPTVQALLRRGRGLLPARPDGIGRP